MSLPSWLSWADAWAVHVAGLLVEKVNLRMNGATTVSLPLFDPASKPFEQRTLHVRLTPWLGVERTETVSTRGCEAPAVTVATPPEPLAVAVVTESPGRAPAAAAHTSPAHTAAVTSFEAMV